MCSALGGVADASRTPPPLATGGTFFSDAARNVLAIDLRSLAAFRIGIAAILLIDLGWRAWDAAAFLSDDGILPRVVLIEILGPGHSFGQDHSWSLHLLSGQVWTQLLLIAVAAWFAGWLLIGYRSRLAAFASWLLLVSIVNRNPLVSDAGDAVLRNMLLWSLFLPLGARCSIDAWCGRRSGRAGADSRRGDRDQSHPCQADGNQRTPDAVFSFGSAAALLQLLAVYVSAALFKMGPVWTRELSGVYYALNCDAFATSWGLYLRQFPAVMQALTAGTLVLELTGPILLLSPWGNRGIRCVVAAAFCTFHLGLVATMTLGLFPWICITSWLLFVPGLVWTGLGRVRRRLRRSLSLAAAWERALHRIRQSPLRSRWWSRAEQPNTRNILGLEILAAILLLFAMPWNARDLLPTETANRLFPQQANRIAAAIGLEKGWSMFAPVPFRDDGWPIFRGTLHDGTEVNLWEPGQPLPWDKPRLVSALYHGQRWRRCLENVSQESYAWNRPYFADFLQRRWNRKFAVSQPEREVAIVELLRRLEPTPPPGEPFLPIETVTLWTRHYEHP